MVERVIPFFFFHSSPLPSVQLESLILNSLSFLLHELHHCALQVTLLTWLLSWDCWIYIALIILLWKIWMITPWVCLTSHVGISLPQIISLFLVHHRFQRTTLSHMIITWTNCTNHSWLWWWRSSHIHSFHSFHNHINFSIDVSHLSLYHSVCSYLIYALLSCWTSSPYWESSLNSSNNSIASSLFFLINTPLHAESTFIRLISFNPS